MALVALTLGDHFGDGLGVGSGHAVGQQRADGQCMDLFERHVDPVFIHYSICDRGSPRLPRCVRENARRGGVDLRLSVRGRW